MSKKCFCGQIQHKDNKETVIFEKSAGQFTDWCTDYPYFLPDYKEVKNRHLGRNCRDPDAVDGERQTHPCALDSGNPCRKYIVAEASL
jgi:hypothetical protein